jgi:hypothetical protein
MSWDLRTFSEYFLRATTDRLNEIPSETQQRELASDENQAFFDEATWTLSYVVDDR